MQRRSEDSTVTRVLARAKLTPFKAVGLLLTVVAFVMPLVIDVPGLEPAGQRMLAVFCMALVLFVTEAIPLHATGALIILTQILLLTDQSPVPLAEPVGSSGTFLSALADPTVILFLGGFLIADGATKYRLDRNLASLVLTPFKDNARLALLALMLLTAVASFFMSNTATAATMFAVLIPVLAGLPNKATKAGFALAIPLAANLGGLGTPVASPPNAIAVAALAQRGHQVSFVDWMLAMVPLMLVILGVCWLFLCWRYVPGKLSLNLDLKRDFSTRPAAVLFYVIAGATIIGWFTEPLHGISASTVGFAAAVALLASKVMSGDDLRALQWPVLWLVAGGISLGAGVGLSGLDEWLVGLVSWETIPAAMLLFVLALVCWAMGNGLSNSATANLLIPIGLALAVSIGENVMTVGLLLAAASAMSVMLPVSTPPNAIAYATGTIKIGDLATVGAIVGVLGVLLVSLVMPHLWVWLGIV